VPFPESSLNEEAGKLFMEDYESYFKHAKLITELHAVPKELKKLENNVNIKVASENSNDMNEEKEKLEVKVNKKENDKKKWMKRI
jgi:ubiquitin-conjugating enzyme E2 S